MTDDKQQHSLYLIQISGRDQVGVMAGVSDLLAKENAVILDVGESVIHATLSLGFLVELSLDTDCDQLNEKLCTLLEPIGLSATMEQVSDASYASWVERGGQMRYIITLLADPLTAEQLHAISTICARHELSIDRMRRLSGRPHLNGRNDELHCVEMSVRGFPDDSTQLRADWLRVSQELGLDISVQADNVFRRHRRLVAFDMDSTLIEMEIIDALANITGNASQVQEITEAAMQGQIDFTDSLRSRTKMLAGLPEMLMQELATDLPITPGAERLIRILRFLGFKVAIISGGFDYFANYLGRKLGADYVFANQLECRDGELTGNIVGDVVDRKRKADLLREISQKEGIAMDQVIAVGDGANDLEMLSAAGLGVAYRAKPTVVAESDHSISKGGLDTILFLLGISHQELGQTLEKYDLFNDDSFSVPRLRMSGE